MTNTYPLIRIRWSNEHIMAALFAVLLLYMLPVWIGKPGDIPAFLAVLAFSLVLDAVCGFLRYKRPVCSVSAAVTAGILQVLTPGIPLWGRLIGIFAAIIIGKQLWGGTGKNTMNPAILGYFVICIMFTAGTAPVETSILLIPALILSLPFILFRPFAALGYFAGIVAAWLTGGIAELAPIAASCIFLGSIVLTDPVTVTPLKSLGLAGGFAAAFLPLFTAKPAMSFALAILIFNLISYLAGEYFVKPHKKRSYSGITMKSPYRGVDYSSPALDLSFSGKSGETEVCAAVEPSGNGPVSADNTDNTVSAGNTGNAGNTDKSGIKPADTVSPGAAGYTPGIILERIKRNEVYGMGGGAFPAAAKISDVISSGSEKKFFVVNAVECDPGLIHDKWILKNRLEEVLKGIELVSRCIHFDKKIIAVKAGTEITCPDDINISRIKDYYPAGYEKSLIRSVLGVDVPEGSIPSRQGILVVNVQTLLAVYEAVTMDKKADSKYITVSDLKNGTAKAVRVSLGAHVTDAAENIYPGGLPVFTGGGVMQSHMADESDLIGKNTNFIAVSSMPEYKDSPLCSNCGSCRANCPKGLAVNRIAELTDLGKFDEIMKYQPEKCIKCGLCSYVCLAGKNLSAKVAEAREKVLL